MNKLDIAKTVVNFVVGAGVTKIVNDIIINNTNPEKVTEKVAVATGAVALGMMAKDATKVYTSAKIDEYATLWETVKTKLEENAKKNQD